MSKKNLTANEDSSFTSVHLSVNELKSLLKEARKKENKGAKMRLDVSSGSGIGSAKYVSFNEKPSVDITDYGVW